LRSESTLQERMRTFSAAEWNPVFARRNASSGKSARLHDVDLQSFTFARIRGGLAAGAQRCSCAFAGALLRQGGFWTRGKGRCSHARLRTGEAADDPGGPRPLPYSDDRRRFAGAWEGLMANSG